MKQKSKKTVKTKKLIALACSPSKGFNSDTMLDAFLSGVAKIKKVRFEKVYLIDIPQEFYRYENKVADPKKEPELVKLIDKIVKADGLVIATPTYNFGVPADLKNLIDRMSYKALDYQKLNWLKQPTGMLGHVNVFALVSCGTPWWAVHTMFEVFPIFWFRMMCFYYNMKMRGGIYGAGLNSKHPAKDDKPLLKRCERAGKEFSKAL